MKRVLLALTLVTSVMVAQTPKSVEPPPAPTMTEGEKKELQTLMQTSSEVQEKATAQMELLNKLLEKYLADIEAKYPGYTVNPRTMVLVVKQKPPSPPPPSPVKK